MAGAAGGVDAVPRRQARYQMDQMIRYVLLSGVLQAAGDLQEAMRLAISAALPAPFAQPFLALLQQPRATASRTSLLRHRLTLHLGWLRLCQQ
eukprot:9325941-Alexandrium_andersonii.AAC.1